MWKKTNKIVETYVCQSFQTLYEASPIINVTRRSFAVFHPIMYVTHRSFAAPAPAIQDFFWLYHTYSLLQVWLYFMTINNMVFECTCRWNLWFFFQVGQTRCSWKWLRYVEFNIMSKPHIINFWGILLILPLTLYLVVEFISSIL